jgi:hypothetical protein
MDTAYAKSLAVGILNQFEGMQDDEINSAERRCISLAKDTLQSLGFAVTTSVVSGEFEYEVI